MSDTRWFEIEADLAAAAHFTRAAAIFEARATEAARAATLLSRQLPDVVAAFRAAVDPD